MTRESAEFPPEGVCAPGGFRAAGVRAGLKSTGARDLALVVNDGPFYAAAAVFTKNRVNASPVQISQEHLGHSATKMRAVVLNSGGANACTGEEGLATARAMTQQVSVALGCDPTQVLVCSTGLIGQQLPREKVLAGIIQANAQLGPEGGIAAAEAIMTTDTVSKTSERVGQGYTIGAMAKGAGMLAPSLATMLVVITTDAFVSQPELAQSLTKAVERSFNRLDSDGCTSTNDTVIVLANGASGVQPDMADFNENLTQVCLDLVQQLLSDTEGSSKDISISVEQAASEAEALEVGRAIARSNLFKCAMFGEDPNWGRILSEVGLTSATFDPHQLNVRINDVLVCENSTGLGVEESVPMKGRAIKIQVELKSGTEQATIWTNDLTTDYVHENSAYSS